MSNAQYACGGAGWAQSRTGKTSTPGGLDTCITSIASGDRSAFEHLYRHTVGQVEKVAFAVVRDHHLAQDITQEVFLDVWRNAADFDPTRASVLSWLTMIAHRRAVDAIRHEQALKVREQRHGLRGQGWMPTVADPVGDQVLTRLDVEAVQQVLVTLHLGQRQILLLTFFAGSTYRQAARALGVAEGTAKTRIRAVLRRMSKETVLRAGRIHQRAT